MRILIFGATGMVGQAAVQAALADQTVTEVVAIGRTATGLRHPKLRDIVHKDLFNYTAVEDQLTGIDACCFCLGVTSRGLSEADYTRLTYDLTLAAARALVRLNPAMVFVYVSGEGADSTEQGKVMWARVRGRTENALQALPFPRVAIFRPGIIRPLAGIRSKTPEYRWFYNIFGGLLGLLRHFSPTLVATTDTLGRALLLAARQGPPRRLITSRQIEGVLSEC